MAEKEHPDEESPTEKLQSEEVAGDDQKTDLGETEEGEEEFEGEEEEDEEEDEEDEEEEEEEAEVRKVRRCVRRKRKKKPRQIVVEAVESEEEFSLGDEEEDEEDEESEAEYEAEASSSSEYSSILSAVSFIWEDERYEFLDLCDPGTIDNILHDRPVLSSLYDPLGAETYLHLCDKLKIAPIVRFYNSLDTEVSNLACHGVNKKHMKAICATLELNQAVEMLILKGNILSPECCRYLELLLLRNGTLKSLDLSGCKIGPEGADYLSHGLMKNETLKELNLSKCNIRNEGMKSLMPALMNNFFLENVILSYNKLGSIAADALGTVFAINNSIASMDLDYNDLYDPVGMKKFFRGLNFNSSLTNLYLKWNAMSAREIVDAVSQFIRRNTTIQYLDLSDNRFDGFSIRPLKRGLAKAESLQVLRLARNPLSSADVEFLLPAVKTADALQLLDFDDIWVEKNYLKIMKKVEQVKTIEVIIGGIYSNYILSTPDYPAIILKRAQFEAMKPKKKKAKKDFGHLMFMLGDEPLTENEFMTTVKKFKAKVNKALYPELIKQYLIPKLNLIDVVSMRQKYLSLFPDTKPPEPKKQKGSKMTEKTLPQKEKEVEKEVALKKPDEEGDFAEIGEDVEDEQEMVHADGEPSPSVAEENENVEEAVHESEAVPVEEDKVDNAGDEEE